MSSSADCATQAVLRHALARGFLTREQLGLAQEALAQQPQSGDLLAILRAQFLSPDCLPELAEVYRQALESDSAADLTRPDVPGAVPGLEVASTVGGTSVGGGGSHSSTSRPLPQQIGDYRVVNEIARGGMGIVYRAHSLTLDRPVALKVMRDADLATEEEEIRFFREARAAARLRHPSIVGVHEIGSQHGRHFIAMDLIEGLSLKHRVVADGPLPCRQAARLTERLAGALAYAHEHRILHRDLKPANILLARDGTPLITDFGLAKEVGETDGMTLTGQVVGTPAYMPPEQARGETSAIGPAADIYSLGATLFEMLTGQRPFGGPNTLATLTAVVSLPPPRPRSLRPEIPRDLETICLKCLEKDPAARYDSAAALQDDLRRYLDDESISARVPTLPDRVARWTRRHRAAATAAAVTGVAALVVGVGGYAFVAGREAAQSEQRLATRQEHLDTLLAQLGEGEAVSGARRQWIADELARVAGAELVGDLVRRLEAVTDQSRTVVREALSDVSTPTEFELEAGQSALAGGQAVDQWFGLSLGEELTPEAADALEASLERLRSRTLALPGNPVGHQELKGWQIVAHRQGRRLPAQLVVADVLCLALGRIPRAREQSREALGAHLRAECDPLRATRPAIALCRLGDEASQAHVFRALRHFGPSSPFRAPVRRALEDVEAEAPAVAATVEGWIERAQMSLDKSDAQAAIEDAGRAIEAAPDDARGWALRAEARLSEDDYFGARHDVQRALALDPDHVQGLLVRASLEDQRDHDRLKALATYSRAVEVAPHDVRTWFCRSLLHKNLGDFERALEDAARAIEISPQDPRGWSARGAAYHDQGNLDLALAAYDRAIELDPDDPMGYCHRGIVRHARGEDDEAYDDLSRALSLASAGGYDLARILSSRAWLLHERGDNEAALEDANAAVQLEPGDASVYQTRGAILMKLGQDVAGRADLDVSLELDPNNAMGWVNRARGRRLEGDQQGALSDLERALRLDPDHAFALATRGQVRVGLGDRGGLQDLYRATTLDSGDPLVWSLLGETQLRLDDEPGALSSFRRAAEVSPNDPDVWDNLANVHRRLGEHDQAMQALEEGLASNPQNAKLWSALAVIRYLSGDHAGAESAYMTSLRFDPDSTESWTGRALAHAALGDEGSAQRELARAVSADPESPVLWRLRANTRAILGDGPGAMEDLDYAIERFSEASLYLLRGKLRTRSETRDLEGACRDFRRFLQERPTDPSAAQIRVYIAHLEQQIQQQAPPD